VGEFRYPPECRLEETKCTGVSEKPTASIVRVDIGNLNKRISKPKLQTEGLKVLGMEERILRTELYNTK
jgi:hypothetical protein